MLSERELKDVIEKIIGEMKIDEPSTTVEEKAPVVSTSSVYIESGDEPCNENPHCKRRSKRYWTNKHKIKCLWVILKTEKNIWS